MPYTWPGVVDGTVADADVINDLGEEVETLSALVRVALGALVTRSTAQSIATSTPTLVQFTAEAFDSGGLVNLGSLNTTVTLTEAGLYFVAGNGSYATNGTGARVLAINLNGATLVRDTRSGLTGNAASMGVATGFVGSIGDAITLQADQSSGGNLNFSDVRLIIARVAIV